MTISWHSADRLAEAVRAKIADVDVVLDIGCGIQPQTLTVPLVHICCEPFAEYASHLQATLNSESRLSYVVLQHTWAEILTALPEKSVDTVFLLDVIEHLDKEEGRALLARTDRVARKQIVVFTPLGFMPQSHPTGTDAWGLGGGAWQEHKSGWVPEEFGEGWQILAARDYHVTDNLGTPLATPFGAFFAIKTIGDGAAPSDREALVRRAHALTASIADVRVLAEVVDLIREAARIYLPLMLRPPRLLLSAELRVRDSRFGRIAHAVARRIGAGNVRGPSDDAQ